MINLIVNLFRLTEKKSAKEISSTQKFNCAGFATRTIRGYFPLYKIKYKKMKEELCQL